jgi:L-2-amino-thiazoline-4-carboxylic acid hydrolase
MSGGRRDDTGTNLPIDGCDGFSGPTVLVSLQSGFAMVEGFSPGLTLTRTQTIMEGASQCDFHFVRKAVKPGTAGPT